MPDEKNQRIALLEELIRRHQDLYYNAQPEISDQDFDALWSELESLDPENQLFLRVGADAADGWPKTRHVMPMGSQAKAPDPADFLAWAAKTPSPGYLVQHKLDGASLELQYEGGVFARAVTRGDGSVGDDISPNARRMNGVLARLPETFTGAVRGEVLMPRAVHAAKYADKANCRNAANGLMKRKDGKGAADLDVVCYDALGRLDPGGDPPAGLSGSPFADEPGKVDWLGRMGFKVVPSVLLPGPGEVVEHWTLVMGLRASLPYDIDGLVVKSLEIDPDDMARARPEKQIAFKFSPEEAVTTVREVEWSESGSNYTPVAIVDPVRLAGTVVRRASLANPATMRALGLMVGSRVVVTKRGEIIPKIEMVLESPEGSVPVDVPSICGCGTPLVDEGASLHCPNPACPKKVMHRLEKWISVLDVRDFGSVILGKLHDSGKVGRIADLYSLSVADLAAHDRMGETLAAKILRNLASRRDVDLAEFVAGFDIDGVGLLVAQKLVDAGFDTLDSLFAASPDDLDRAEGVAETTARTIAEGLAALRDEMEAVLATGAVRIRPPRSRAKAASPGSAQGAGGARGDAVAQGDAVAVGDCAGADKGGGTGEALPLEGKSFCFTGELVAMKRADAARLVKDLGGRVLPSVTKDLDFLVTNDPGSGSEKNRKAEKLGIRIIGEDEFLELAGRT